MLFVDEISALENIAGVHSANLHNELNYPSVYQPESIYTALAPDQGSPIVGNRSSFDISSKKG